MALPILRRRAPDATNMSIQSHRRRPKPLFTPPSPFPPLLLLLAMLLIWSSSPLLSGSFFHICISSRKLQLYCISGGTGRDTGLANELNSISETSNQTLLHGSRAEKANAVRVVEEKMKVIRSWASSTRNNKFTGPACSGREIFVYDLPAKFNMDLIEQCHDLLPWTDLCGYFNNEAMGEPIPKLGKFWYKTHQYSLEPIFHARVLRHPCRVYSPDRAKFFYVPFYGGLDILRWHFKNASDEAKDALGIELIRWLDRQTPWVRNYGKDHVFVLGKISWDFHRSNNDSWGTNFLDLDAMQNPYKFLIERQPWQLNEIGVPHPTHFHPHSDEDIIAWKSKVVSSPRKHLVSFAGAARPEDSKNIRSLLIKQCLSSGESCRFLDCNSGACSNPEEVIEMFMESEFCLQPPGDSPTRKSFFDSLIAGCIPVLFDPFTAFYQYPWHLPEDHSQYSVFIDQEEVRQKKVDVMVRLSMVSLKNRENMRRYIVDELLPGLVYGDSSSEFEKFNDAFGVVMNNLLNLVSRV